MLHFEPLSSSLGIGRHSGRDLWVMRTAHVLTRQHCVSPPPIFRITRAVHAYRQPKYEGTLARSPTPQYDRPGRTSNTHRTRIRRGQKIANAVTWRQAEGSERDLGEWMKSRSAGSDPINSLSLFLSSSCNRTYPSPIKGKAILLREGSNL